MDNTQFASIDLGSHSDKVKEVLRTLFGTRLLQFQGNLGSRYSQVEELAEALHIAQEEHDDGLNWLTLRDHEDAYATGGGSFLQQQPWRSLEPTIRSFYGLLDTYVNNNLPQHLRWLYDDVFADLRSCVRCLIFRGSMDEFHVALWEAYIQGGWPCGWSGDIVEREDGSYDISRARICVYWNP